jgi:hypothetical protein
VTVEIVVKHISDILHVTPLSKNFSVLLKSQLISLQLVRSAGGSRGVNVFLALK